MNYFKTVWANTRYPYLALLTTPFVLALALVTGMVVKELITRMPVQQTVDPQVGELAARLRIAGSLKLETASVTDGTPPLMTLAHNFGLEELPAATIQHVFKVSARYMETAWAPYAGERTDYTGVPGLHWEAGQLVNEWGGSVRLFRKGDFILVAYDKVPDDLCQRMQLGAFSLTSYVFACNNTVHLVEDRHSVVVDVTRLRPMAHSI